MVVMVGIWHFGQSCKSQGWGEEKEDQVIDTIRQWICTVLLSGVELQKLWDVGFLLFSSLLALLIFCFLSLYYVYFLFIIIY